MGAGDIVVVEQDRADDFPAAPAAVGRHDLDEAARAGHARARDRAPWHVGGPVEGLPLASLVPTVRAQLAADAARRTGHLKADDGTDVVVAGPALDDATLADVLRRGGGVLLDQVEGGDPLASVLVGRLSAAWQARVTAMALWGSEPTRVLDPQIARTCVIPVTHPVIVRADDGVPFDVPAGHAAVVDGLPRVVGGPDVLTLLLVAPRFLPATMALLLQDRARFHPRLRLDAPLDIAAPAEVYGSAAPVSYAAVVEQEVAALMEGAPREQLEWWWLLSQRLAPARLPGDGGGRRAWGRFPAGVGIARGDAGLIRAGGATVLVPEERTDLLLDLLSGAEVPCGPDAPGRTSIEALASVGLVEIVDG